MFPAKAASLRAICRVAPAGSPMGLMARRALLSLAVTLTTTSAWAQGVQVALVPSSYPVAPGSYDTLFIRVLHSDSTFNAFEFVIGYDPTKVTEMPTAPIAGQLGPLVTAACSNNFHRFINAGDSLSISETMLCPTAMPTGPGTIYQMRFLAGPGTGLARFTVRAVRFAGGGLYRDPVFAADTSILVGPTASVPPSNAPSGWRLAASPDPSRGPVSFRYAVPGSVPHRLDVYDTAGRRVRALESDSAGAAERVVQWDGRDDVGRILPAGVYRAVLSGGGPRAQARVTLIR